MLQEWAGLGYYARAATSSPVLVKVARLGGFPRTAVELRKLPGLGSYTAAAIAAIAFGERATAVDTNVARWSRAIMRLKNPWPRRATKSGNWPKP